jgi:thiamine biosynthesis lipoprotein
MSRVPRRLARLLALAAAVIAGVPAARGEEVVERRLALMGTTLELAVAAESRAAALAASEAAVAALEATAARLSTWSDDGELARWNASPVGAPRALSPALYADLAVARHFYQLTGGAFDPALGALVEAWGLRQGGRVPDDAALEAARAASGMERMALLPDGRAVRHHPGLRIEEGGFGKGIGLDAAARAALLGGASWAVFDLGGQWLVAGEPEDSLAVALADPRDRSRPVARVPLRSGSLATSGNSEHGFTRDGVRYGHLLDPRTGAPAADFGSLTIWARDATTADCLSKLFVLGPDSALAFAAREPAIEAVVIQVEPDGGLAVRATRGIESRIAVLADQVRLARTPPVAKR